MENVGYDKQDPKAWQVGAATAVILAFTFITGWVVQVYFDVKQREQYTALVLQAPTTELNKLRAEADVRLHKYGWADKAAGVAHMPIDEAMKLVVADIKARASQPASAPVVDKKDEKKKK